MLAWLVSAEAHDVPPPAPGAGEVWWIRGADVMAGAGREGAFASAHGQDEQELGHHGAHVLGDVDGNGIADWWVAGHPPSVLQPTGASHLAELDRCYRPVGDLDGDGLVDLACPWPERRLAVLPGALLGDEPVANTRRVTIGLPESIPSGQLHLVAVGDVDGDGFDDLGLNVGTGGGRRRRCTAVVLRGPVTSADREAAWATRRCLLGAGDFDGDGHADPVVRTAGRLELVSGASVAGRQVRLARLRRGGPGANLAVLDADGDGLDDLALAASSGSAGVDAGLYRGRSLADGRRRPDLTFSWDGARGAVPVPGGDLDGAGRDEWIVLGSPRAGQPREVLVFAGASLPWGGRIGPDDAAARIAGVSEEGLTTAAVGDADGDGDDDLMVGDGRARPAW